MKKVSVISKTPENWNGFEATAACDELFEVIKAVLKELAEEDVLYLVTPMNLGPETLAAEAALRLQARMNIKLECVLPYEEQAKDWSESERDRYFSIVEGCDRETLISAAYTDNCEQKCYDYLVKAADIILLGTAPTDEISEIIKSSGKQIITI